LIALTNISFQYQNSDFCLKLNELSIKSGTKTAVIGPSGFGKTTFLNLISGIYLPQHGSIVVQNKTVNELSDSERRTFRLINFGFVFQDFKLLDYLTVMDNILLPCRINGVLQLSAKMKQNARKISSLLQIEDKLRKYPEKLSQGERQRVAICRALLNDPPIILADEPTGNLDPENKNRIMRILFDYVNEKKSTLITVTHDHELLKGFDRIIDFKDIYQVS